MQKAPPKMFNQVLNTPLTAMEKSPLHLIAAKNINLFAPKKYFLEQPESNIFIKKVQIYMNSTNL